MILLGHNANLTEIQTPGVPADLRKGIPGTGAVTRWQGTCQAYIDEDVIDEIKGGARMQVSQTIVDVAVNLPVWPNQEDLITIVRIGPPYNYAQGWPTNAPQSETLIVRRTDGGLVMLGKLRLYVTRGAGTP